MADKKISQLTTLAQADVAPTADFLPIVDTGSTETKKATPQAVVLGTLGATSANVGIGTASPGARLQVKSSAAQAVNIEGTTARGSGNIFAAFLDPTGRKGYFGYGSASDDGFYLYNEMNAPMVFATNNTERMRLDSSGNLGIGTASPISGAGLTIGNDGNGNATVKAAFSTSSTERASLQMNALTGEMRLTAGYSGYGGLLTIHANGSERMRVTSDGNIVAGASAALATNATNGFLYVPTCAGTPTGTPTAITGMAPIVVNTTNNKLYFYSGGAWRDAGP